MNRLKTLFGVLKHSSNLVFFIVGFLFDAVTLVRIDSLLDLSLHAVYLALITGLILENERRGSRPVTSTGWIARLWRYESELLHFCYGGLLSAFVVLYFKSTSVSRSLFFFVPTVLLMVANEMPQVRRVGHRLRLGLYAFCQLSFMNYLVPIALGVMGGAVFLLSVLLAGVLTGGLVWAVHRLHPSRTRASLAAAPTLVFAVVIGSYFLKWIPPVPLSLQFAGIFHGVERVGKNYQLAYWRRIPGNWFHREDRRFLYREGDRVHFFVRVFGPRRFRHALGLVWEHRDPASGRWNKTDRVPLEVRGGRAAGYRGWAAKANYAPGRWRVSVVTEDDRSLGGVNFTVAPDPSAEPRVVKIRRM
ncbi:MAG: DUF2914 domain-containing protein [Elusimicrobia bacterium]|nr:DUF2914 domain-containing protein [Elusimicrobiota bacterium]